MLSIGSRRVGDLGRGLGCPRGAIGCVLGCSSSNRQGISSHVGVVLCRFHVLCPPPHLQAGDWVQCTGLIARWCGFGEADHVSAMLVLLELGLA